MLSRFLARLVLAAVLLAAWQVALLHPLAHVDAHGGFVHLSDGSEQGKKSDASGLCDALAALTACASGEAKVVSAVSSAQVSSDRSTSAPRAAEAPPFLSQGPPALL
jgi:hypothetical protein